MDSLLILFLIYLLPYCGVLLKSRIQFKLKAPLTIISVLILFLWFYGFEIEYKSLEFFFLYLSSLIIIISILQNIEKIYAPLAILFFIFHSVFSIFTVIIFEQRANNYFEEKAILAENETYFILFEQESSFSLNMSEYFILCKKVFGKKVYKKLERKFVKISSIQIQMEEMKNKVIVTTSENEIFEYIL